MSDEPAKHGGNPQTPAEADREFAHELERWFWVAMILMLLILWMLAKPS